MAQDTRTTTALAQLAGGILPPNLKEILAPGHVNIAIDSLAAREPQGQLLMSFAVNLLARLHPVVQRITVVISDDASLCPYIPRWREAGTLSEHLKLLLSGLRPPLAWGITDRVDRSAAVSLLVGAIEGPGQCVWAGSRGWFSFVSPGEATPVGGLPNPVGAYSAACLGVGEVWKRLLFLHRHVFPTLPIVPFQKTLTFSTLTYQPDAGSPNPDIPSQIDLRCLTIVGLGAGGGATAFTIGSLQEVSGHLVAIEPDSVDDTNLNRYVFADSQDVGHPKVDVVQDFLKRFPTLTVTPYPWAFSQVAPKLSPDHFKYVVAAVHSREARREIQLETPEVLWDAAAAEDGEFRVWRLIFGITECMHCKHPPGEHDQEEQKSRQLAKLLGLDWAAWLRKIKDNETFTAEDVAAITQHIRGQKIAFDIPKSSQRFGDWEAAQCGKLILPNADDSVPIPFAPVMAGVLLAGEMIKEHYFPEHVLDSYYWNTLLGQFVLHNRPRRRGPRSHCACCGDIAFQQQHRRRWAAR